MSMEQQPIIAIYKDGLRYRVEIDGEEIERLRHFKVELDAHPRKGEREAPYYEIQQYLPANHPARGFAKSVCQQPAEQLEETLKSTGRISF